MPTRRSTSNVELVVDAKAPLGEGPLWHVRRQSLFWVDILGGRLHEFSPRTGRDRAVDVGQYIGCVLPRGRGGLLLGLQHGLAWFDLRTRRHKMFAAPEGGRKGQRCNDGKCDPAGRLWVGAMSVKLLRGKGRLYSVNPDLGVRQVLDKLTIPNGLAWSHDARTMYFIDSAAQAVAAFDYDLETGGIRRRRVLIRIPKRDGTPDGMSIDAEGMLWVAHWGGWRVTRWDPVKRRLLQTVWLPVSQVTSCAFGGKNLDELYVTSARDGLSERKLAQEPAAGGVFRCRPGVRGLPAHEFAG